VRDTTRFCLQPRDVNTILLYPIDNSLYLTLAVRGRGRGFSLIELMIVIAIFSIIMTLSIGGYRQHLRRTNRSDATVALLRIAAAQERYYLDHDGYAKTLVELGFPATSERGYYLLATESGDPVRDFRAEARPDPHERQHDDHACNTFTIDQSGLRGAATSDARTSANDVERCWR